MKTILLIDDDSGIRDLISLVLRNEDYKVIMSLLRNRKKVVQILLESKIMTENETSKERANDIYPI